MFRMPHAPCNPRGPTIVHVGTNGTTAQTVSVPPAVVVFGSEDSVVKTRGRAKSSIPAGSSSCDGQTNPAIVIGVSMDGIVDPKAAAADPDHGRHGVVKSGIVTLTAAIDDGAGGLMMPKVLSTLYVCTQWMSIFRCDVAGNVKYTLPSFASTKVDPCYVPLGVVTRVNDAFAKNQIAEVEIHLTGWA